MTVQISFRNYVDNPTIGTLNRLHADILAASNFERETRWMGRARELLEQERYDEAIRLLEGWMPGALFCIPAHHLLSASYAGIGDDDNSRRHGYYSRLALAAILLSGDGTQQSPWLVLHVVDEYAVLADANLECVQQRVQLAPDGAMVDVLTCTDGSDRWFKLVK